MDDQARIQAHHRGGDGRLHCAEEYRARLVDTPNGPVEEIRCDHWRDVLRYDRISPAELRRIAIGERERLARLTAVRDG